ncbi:hypothetical protein PUN28_015904 [Cardiocondyla obscurior]|uniref:Uncharacterized protein n=1 Tax=Cardiocondyla obscurior TaxID=286306 RepID=A0AAW2EVX7_9HYME
MLIYLYIKLRIFRHLCRKVDHITLKFIFNFDFILYNIFVTSLLCISSPFLLLDKWLLVFNTTNRATCINERKYRANKNGQWNTGNRIYKSSLRMRNIKLFYFFAKLYFN